MPAKLPSLAGVGLGLLRRIAGNRWLDRAGLRPGFERLVFRASRGGFAAAARVGRVSKSLHRPGRPPAAGRGGLFDLSPSDDQAMLRDAAARFAGERLRPAAFAADADAAAPGPLLAQAAQLGLAALAVPQELGGAGDEHSPVTGALIAESLAQGDMGLALACLAPVGVANALLRWGSADQQSRYLAPFTADAPPVAALAVAEPQPLFDAFALQTVAREQGDSVILDGSKSLVPRACEAAFFLVAAQPPAGAPQFYIVERDTKGVSVTAEPGMGLRAAATGRLDLRKLRLPAAARLGADAGCDYPQAIALMRLAWCAMAVGSGQAVLDYVRDYVNQREAFGEPISHRQAVAFAVADIAIELEGLRLATWRAAALAAAGAPFTREAALARRLAARHAMGIGSAGVQLLGGHGFVKDHPVERWYRDLRAAGIMEGGLSL